MRKIFFCAAESAALPATRVSAPGSKRAVQFAARRPNAVVPPGRLATGLGHARDIDTHLPSYMAEYPYKLEGNLTTVARKPPRENMLPDVTLNGYLRIAPLRPF